MVTPRSCSSLWMVYDTADGTRNSCSAPPAKLPARSIASRTSSASKVRRICHFSAAPIAPALSQSRKASRKVRRQRRDERAASVDLAVCDDDVAAKEARELTTHGETETAAVGVPSERVVRLPEGLEDVRLIPCCDPAPRVRHLEIDLPRSAEPLDAYDEQHVADVRVFHGVRDQIDEDLPQLDAVRLESDRRIEAVEANVHSLQLRDRPNDSEGFVHDVDSDDGLHMNHLLSGVEPCVAEQLFNQRQHMFPRSTRTAEVIFLHRCDLAGDLVLEQLRVADDGVQRRP